MAMFNYESEALYQQVRGETTPSSPVYVAECKKEMIDEVSPNYPQLVEYEKEWLNFAQHVYHDGTPVPLEYQEVDTYDDAIVENAIPFYYKGASLKGNTKYRDIDTGDILDTFDETKNLELVSVKVPVLTTTGKNLFDGELEKGAIVSSTGTNIPTTDNVRSVGYVKVKPNTSIVISNDLNYSNDIIYEYDSNKNYIGRKETNPFTTSTNCQYIRFRSGGDQPNLDVKYQIEYGTIATPYEPFKSNILTVNEPVELRRIGDVHDTLDLLTGEVVESITIKILNSNDSSIKNIASYNTDNTLFFEMNISAKSNIFLNSHFKVSTSNISDIRLLDEELSYIDVYWQKLIIKINKTKVTNLNEFKQWLSSNNVMIQYIAKEKVHKTVDLNQNIKPYEGTNHYQVSSDTIPPQLLLSVPVVSTGKHTLNDIITEE